MYQPSRHLSTFFIAGFQHYDGALVINQMSIGDSIELCPEPGNPLRPRINRPVLQRRHDRLYPRRPEQPSLDLISLWPQEHPRVPHSSSRQRSCSLEAGSCWPVRNRYSTKVGIMFESPTKFLKTLDSRDFDELISIKDDLNYLIDELEHEIREPEDFRTEHDLPLKVAYVNALRCMTGLTSHMSLRVNEFIDSWKWEELQ